MYLWPDEFREYQQPNGMVHKLVHLYNVSPFLENEVFQHIKDCLQESDGVMCDKKLWRLTGNGVFLLKSFYSFLIDGGVRSPVAKVFWRNWCPKKINLFYCLAWKNEILMLKNLAHRTCNRLPAAICVLCRTGIETADHLFIHYPFAKMCGITFLGFFSFLIHLLPCVTFGGNGGHVGVPLEGILGTLL